MGQTECLDYLERKKDWVKTIDICDDLGQIPGLVNRSLRKLFNQRLINRRNCKFSNGGYEWRING